MEKYSDDDELKKLAESNPKIAQLLYANPFDPLARAGGLISENMFYGHLYVEPDHWADLALELRQAINDDSRNYQVFIGSGFPGVGKTTFLRKFMHDFAPDTSVFVDLHADPGLNKEKSPGEVEDESESWVIETMSVARDAPEFKFLVEREQLRRHPINSALKGKLYAMLYDENTEAFRKEYFGFLATHRKALYSCFSPWFIRHTQKWSSSERVAALYDGTLAQTELSDTLVLFLMICFHRFDRSVPVFVVFDNLDAVHVNFLSKRFVGTFATTLANVMESVQQHSLFPAHFAFDSLYRFFFCLRDGNAAEFNCHRRAVLDTVTLPFEFRIPFHSNTFSTIIDKRFTLYDRLRSQGLPVAGDVEALKILMKKFATDTKSRLTIVPLFDFDYRKVTYALFETAVNSKQEWSCPPSIESEDRDELYGARGALLYWVIRFALRRDFLQQSEHLNDYIPSRAANCSRARMLLTYILNNSNVVDGEELLANAKYRPDPVRIQKILADSAISKLYGRDLVTKVLSVIFAFHQHNWANLITINGGQIGEEERNYDEAEVIINPSGFVYLWRLITHFEHYSNLADNKKPLFWSPVTAKSEFGFSFDEPIRKTREQVGLFIDSMAAFYRDVLQPKLKWDAETYRKSDFAFKHPKLKIEERGLFHATRIITTHVGYLDAYRMFLLKKHKDTDPALAVRVNKSLVQHLSEYVKLLDRSIDPRERDDFKIPFMDMTKQIEKSQYQDFETRIALLQDERD